MLPNLATRVLKDKIEDNLQFIKIPAGIGIVLYLIGFSTPDLVIFEQAAYVFFSIYLVGFLMSCIIKNGKPNSTSLFLKLLVPLVLLAECICSIVFLGNHEDWIISTKKKSKKFINYLDFLKYIFISQIILLQINSKNIPSYFLNGLLITIWVITYVLFTSMMDMQKVY